MISIHPQKPVNSATARKSDHLQKLKPGKRQRSLVKDCT